MKWWAASGGSPISHMVPRLTIHCTYPNTTLAPTSITFTISRSYGIGSAAEAHDWFLRMMEEHEEFAVETDQPGEESMPFWSETARRVVVE